MDMSWSIVRRATDMVSSNCWRCLHKTSPYQLVPPLSFARVAPTLTPSTAPFSTTVTRLVMPAKTKKGLPRAIKGESQFSQAKKRLTKDKGKPPGVGERKAMRKRIVLSNTNALEVKGMSDLTGQTLEDLVDRPATTATEIHLEELVKKVAIGEMIYTTLAKEIRVGNYKLDTFVPNRVFAQEFDISGLYSKPDWVGKVVGLADETVDSLRAVEAFKITQGWELFRRPAILIRKESKYLSERIVRAGEDSKTVRLVVDGAKGSGKSMMLLHALATGFLRGWLIINIPEAQDITNASTEYAAIPGTEPTLWSQNVYTADLLAKIAKANRQLLDRLQVEKRHELPVPLPVNLSLTRLCELGAREPDIAWLFFQVFWAEVTAEGRPPVMMCLDGLNHILQDSLYRAPDMSFIHAQDLGIIRHFTDYLSGSKTVPNGGAFIAATNRSHAPNSKIMNLAIQRAEERASGQVESKLDPYENKYDLRSEPVLARIEALRLAGLSKHETRGLLEYWAQSGILRSRVDEKVVAEKWALAGNGIAGELQRGALWMRI